MAEFCKDKSDEAKKLLAKIQKITGKVDSDQKAVSDLVNLSASLEASGGIKDIIEIATAFFAVPVEEAKPEDVKLEDPEKKLGSFLVKDLCDVPGVDLTKIVKLKPSSLKKLKSLKFSISVATMEAVKTLKFGPISTDIKFLISRKEFNYFPTVNGGVDSKEKALEKLKGLKSLQPLSPSKTTLDEARKIAKKSYGNSKEVMKIVETSLNKEDLLNQLGNIGIVLQKEVDVYQEAKKALDNEAAEKNVIPYEDETCGYPDLVLAPFSPDEVAELEKDCCDPATEIPPRAEPLKAAEIPPIKSQGLTPDEEAKELKKTKQFISDVDVANKTIQKCAAAKQTALNNYYWYLEASFLNEIALEYVKYRFEVLSTLDKTFTSLDLGIKSYQDKQQANLTNQQQLDKAYTNKNDPNYVTSMKVLKDSYNQYQTEIDNLNLQVKNERLKLPSISNDAIINLQTVDLKSSSSILKGKTLLFRKNFSTDNLFTNQAGFNFTSGTTSPGNFLSLYLHPSIVKEAKTLFELNSPAVGDVADYVKTFVTREKDFGNLWGKYYSANVVDNLFTYKEQGYTSPKPVYDENGNPKGPVTTVSIPSVSGKEIKQPVAESVAKLGINEKIALEFWPNLEDKIKTKMIVLLEDLKKTTNYKNLITNIKSAAKNEAEYSFAVNLLYKDDNAFDTTNNVFSSTNVPYLKTNSLLNQFKSQYQVSYESLNEFQATLQGKMNQLLTFVETQKKCISDQESTIINKSVKFSGEAESSDPGIVKDECPPKLGSDPFGLKAPSDCPGITKNCYWAEYTKMMQLVSLMPIPDTEFLTKRLFRYYPVGLQIPVPTPAPGVLPTLASGIPDPLISVPFPIIWKHLVTVTTPMGLFVIWAALAGPIPGTYMMYIDEKVQPCFLVTPKGPISLPAKSIKVSENEEKSLIEFLAPLKDTYKVNIKSPASKALMGNNKFDATDEDSPSGFIDKIQAKIKGAVDSLKTVEPDYVTDAKKERREKIKNALKQFPPNVSAIDDAFKSIEKVIDKQIDSLKISPVKFPKDPKKLATPVVGPDEFTDSVNKLIDSGVDLGELGLSVKILSLRNEIKKNVDKELSTPEVKEKFSKLNQEIADLETRLASKPSLSLQEKRKQRVKEIKKSLKIPVEKIAKTITPETLGFVAIITPPLPLPIPCYGKNVVPGAPPYILAIMAAIKELPKLVDGIPDESLITSLSKAISLDSPLPRVEDLIFFAVKAMLEFVPDLKFPDTESSTPLKQIIKTSIQNFFKVKIRMPHPGAVQITISEKVIKGAIKAGVKLAFAAVVKVVLDELNDAIKNNDAAKVVAVALIIKGIFGTDLGDLSGEDIKSFVASSLQNVDQQLETIQKTLPSLPKSDFKSIKETLFPTLPPRNKDEGPFLEVDTEAMLKATAPLLQILQNLNIPFPVILLGCTLAPTRLALTKLHPYSPKEVLPSWDKMSLKNIPFVIWLDQLIATAQRQGGIASDYVAPYYLPDPPA